MSGLRPEDPAALGAYRIIGRLGEGGQGVVYLGRSEDGLEVAVKLMHRGADENARARFLREARVAQEVAPFCTARVLDAGADGDRSYLVGEFVDGPSLHARVQDAGTLTGSELDRLAVGTATALTAIHRAGVVHRDFKPHNVLLGPDGPRVIDFGVARALSTSTTITRGVIGTPSYMVPEQAEGRDADAAADVFSWASTLVFAATGSPPFGADSIVAVINRIANREPDLGSLSGPLRDLVTEYLAKDPAERPSSEGLLLRLLDGRSAVDSPLMAGAALALGDARSTAFDRPFPDPGTEDRIRTIERSVPDGPAALTDPGPGRSRTLGPLPVLLVAAVLVSGVAASAGYAHLKGAEPGTTSSSPTASTAAAAPTASPAPKASASPVPSHRERAVPDPEPGPVTRPVPRPATREPTPRPSTRKATPKPTPKPTGEKPSHRPSDTLDPTGEA